MTTVYLIRHAEADGNLYRRMHGQYDSTVTARGYRQIAMLAKRFADERIDVVYSSDLTRTQTTALAITRTHGLPLRTSDQLREIGVGEWEDHTWTWAEKFDAERHYLFNADLGNWHMPGGEDAAVVRARMLCALNDIISAHPGQTVAVFSHGMALRLLVGTLQGMSIAEIDKTGHAENTAVTKLIADESGLHIVYRDDASHLPDELTTLARQEWTKNKGGVEPGVWFSRDPALRGRFEVMRGDDYAGAVAVHLAEGGVAEIDELWLETEAQRRGYGIRLVGQAVSCARKMGCDTLEATIARDELLGHKCAMRYGFLPVRTTPETVTYQLYIGYDVGYRLFRFDEEWAAAGRRPAD